MSWLRKSGKEKVVDEPVVSGDVGLVEDIVIDDGEGEVEAEKSQIVPVNSDSLPSESGSGSEIQPSQPTDVGGGFELGEESNSTAVIKGFASANGKFSLAMISKIKRAQPFVSVGLVGEYSGILGLGRRAEFRRRFLDLAYQNNVAVKDVNRNRVEYALICLREPTVWGKYVVEGLKIALKNKK